MQKKKKNIAVIIVAFLLTTGAYAQTWWLNVYNPPPVVYNLRPYYHFQPVKSNIGTMQQNVSDAVVCLKMFVGAIEYPCTGTFIRTDPSLPYIILLMAGHSVIPGSNQPPPSFVRITNIAFRYRRTAMENFGDSFTENVEYSGISYEICRVIEAKNDRDATGNPINDYALIAYPKSVLQSGLSIYEAPYAFPTMLTIPDMRDTGLFVIHHGVGGQPQRICELSNAYTDVAQNKHFIALLPSPYNKFRIIGYWSNGSMKGGSSGAALIYPVTGEPTVVGVLSGGIPNKNLTSSGFPPVTPAMISLFQTDYGEWVSRFYMLSEIASSIRTNSGITDAEALKGLRVTPVPKVSPTTQSVTTQSDLEHYSTEVLGIYNYTHVGDVVMARRLRSIHANIHVEQGRINLSSGFSASASEGVELAIGLISSNISGPALAGRPANLLEENREVVAKPDNSAAQIQESFKVYPSPTRGIISVSPGSYDKAYTVRIVDISGKEVYRDNGAMLGIRHIDLSSKMPVGGTCFLQIQPAEVFTAPVTWKLEVIK